MPQSKRIRKWEWCGNVYFIFYMRTLRKIVHLVLFGHSSQGWPVKTTMTFSVCDLHKNQGIKVDLEEVEMSFLPVPPPVLYKI